MSTTEQLWSRIAERLLDDESLRGDLEDRAYQPLLDWALAAAEGCATTAAAAADPSACAEACAAQLRAVVRAAAQAAVAGRNDELATLARPPVFVDGEAVKERLAALKLDAGPRENVLRLVGALSAKPYEGGTP